MVKRFISAIKWGAYRYASATFLLFILVSFLLWYGTKLNGVYSTSVRIPVVINSSEGNVISSKQSVLCQIKGKGYRILKYRHFSDRSVAKIDINSVAITPIEGTSMNEVAIPSLFAALSKEISDVSIITILTPRFEILVSEVVRKRVPVISRINIECAPQFMIVGKTRLLPDSVDVASLSAIIDTLKGVYTAPESFSQMKGSVAGMVNLLPMENVKSSLSRVSYEVDIEEFTEVEALVPIRVVNYPDSLTPIVIPEKAKVRMDICRSVYDKEVNDIATLYIDYNDRHTNLSDRYKVWADSKRGVVIKQIAPIYVQLIFERK